MLWQHSKIATQVATGRRAFHIDRPRIVAVVCCCLSVLVLNKDPSAPAGVYRLRNSNGDNSQALREREAKNHPDESQVFVEVLDIEIASFRLGNVTIKDCTRSNETQARCVPESRCPTEYHTPAASLLHTEILSRTRNKSKIQVGRTISKRAM